MLATLVINWPEELIVLAQAAVAAALGGLLGWERQAARKRAGLRTHMFVCLAAMLFIRLGQMLITDSGMKAPPDSLRADPIHIIAAIATGISFLGAGTIFHGAPHEKAHGLTTAASLLTTSCIGVAVALNRYVIAVGVTLLALFILHTMRRFESTMRHDGDPP